jgi:xanthine dehydrogenase accessory factor
MFDEFFQKAHELRAEGQPFATAVVVRAEKPTSGKPGDRAIVTLDGTMHGWIGGSCAQPTVVQEAARALVDGTPRLIRLSPDPGAQPTPDGVEEVAMTCFSGGTLDIFIEPHQPTPRLLVVGSLPVAQALAHLGKAMSYHVVAVDPGEGDAMAHADEILRDPAEIAGRVTPLTFAVVATHGDFDEPALEAILETSAPYVGLVASRARGEAVLRSLELDGVDATERSRVRFPAGLDIKAKRGDEIAVSILAEIVEARRTIEELAWDTPSEGEAAPAEPQAAAAEGEDAPSEPETAVDPICQMTVQIEGALHTHEHEGQMYYFCCGGCRSRFAEDPGAYLAAS